MTEDVPHAEAFASFLVGTLVLQTKMQGTNLLRCLYTYMPGSSNSVRTCGNKHPMQWAGWWIVVRSYEHRVIETERREYQECAVGIDEHRAPIIDHLVRRGAGAEDEVLVEAVPAELGVRDVARQGCEKQRGEGPPSHAGSRTRHG